MLVCMRFILCSFLLFITFSVSSQLQKPAVNSNTILTEGAKLHSEKKYKEAIKLYETVSRADTSYADILNNMALAYHADSNFLNSIAVLEKAIKLFPEKNDNWYNLIANSYLGADKTQVALEYYDKVIKTYSHAYLPWYNKGIAHYNKKEYSEAKKCLQQSLLINPYYSPGHFFLASVAYEEGDFVSAMLGYSMGLFNDPEHRFSGSSIRILSEISKVTDEVNSKAAAKKIKLSDEFEMIQEIMLSKAALDKQYKLTVSLEDPIVRQLQVMLEKLEYKVSDKGFTMQYYVPMFYSIYNSKMLEPMVHYIFSSANNKEIQSYIKSNKKKIDALIDVGSTYLSEIRSTQLLQVDARKNAPVHYLFTNSNPLGKGKLTGTGEDAILEGQWEFFYENGALKSKGILDSKQEKIGEWIFYHENGIVKEKTIYKDNKANGASTGWFDNGLLWNIETYKEGENEGLYTGYFYNGALKTTTNYAGGKKNGPVKEYNNSGYLIYTGNYKDDLEDGLFTYYHLNGKVDAIVHYEKGKQVGNYKNYYLDGSRMDEGMSVDGKKTGEWKSYYNNGKIKSVSNYNIGESDGKYLEYFDNGVLSDSGYMLKGAIEGKYINYDVDGKLFTELFYEKGKLRELKYFDKEGKVISNTSTRSGAGNLTFFDANGNKMSEGYFTKEGNRHGKTTHYYSNGKIEFLENYKDGLLQGERISYYPNGSIEAKIFYKDGEQDGYKLVYFQNGKLSYEGMMAKDEKEGQHVEYNLLGNVVSKTDYKEDELDGYAEYYFPDGKLNKELKYISGWLVAIMQYDTLGKVLFEQEYKTGTGKVAYKHLNGIPSIDGQYNHYFLDGAYKTSYVDGSLNAQHYFKLGYTDSICKKYFYGGKLEYEGAYKLAQLHGTWNYYHKNGKLHYTNNYSHGSDNGINKFFDDEGMLDKEISYKEGEFDGLYKVYGDNNTLAIVFNYVNGEITGYSYEGKDGKLLPFTTMKNGNLNMVAYYKNGTKSAEILFEAGKGNGPRNIFFTNGKPSIIGTRINGDDHDLKKVYYKNGQLKTEENYYYGQLHGTVKNYSESGILLGEESYYIGDLHGLAKYYDNAGKLNQSLQYYYGTLASINKIK